jgi:hypothetical protein
MKAESMGWFKIFKITGAVATLGLLAASAANAQAPSGPLGPPPGTPVAAAPAAAPPRPLPPPRTTILGEWRFNKDDSDDPADRERSQDSGGYNGRTRVGGPFPGGGGPYGGHRNGESEEQREKMQTMLRPARTMTLSMTGGEVDLVDEAEHKLEFMTDGRKIQKSKDSSTEEIAAKFDGNRLVTDEKDPRGNKMSRTYELSEDGRQLYETIHLMNNKGNTTRTIRYAYDMPLPTGPRP